MTRLAAAAVLALALLVAFARPVVAGWTSYTGTGCTGWAHEVCYQHRHTIGGATVYHTDHARYGWHIHDTHCSAGVCQYLP